MYENRIMKLVEKVLRRGRKMRENNGEGENITNIYCKHM
jgi:hypothetical protein